LDWNLALRNFPFSGNFGPNSLRFYSRFPKKFPLEGPRKVGLKTQNWGTECWAPRLKGLLHSLVGETNFIPQVKNFFGQLGIKGFLKILPWKAGSKTFFTSLFKHKVVSHSSWIKPRRD